MSQVNWDFYTENGFAPLINVNGTMTSIGASQAVPQAVTATAAIMPYFVDMHELQAKASKIIANSTGAEAGFVAASASAGISMSVAACLTGLDVGRAEQLPLTTLTVGEKAKVAIQMGHLCNYGAAIEQAVRLTGAEVSIVGQSTQTLDHQLETALQDNVVAAIYVVSHHVVEYGQMPLRRFCQICRAANIPVIVDAASEYDLKTFLAQGADIVIYSGHKFLGGPTSGIVAGRRSLIKAAYIQNLGIARGMKIGKESIFGAMAALAAWATRDHDGVRKQEQAALNLWAQACQDFNGISTTMQSDVTHNPLHRLKISVDSSSAGASPAAIAHALGQYQPPILVRDHEVELGYIQLDPCNLGAGHAEIVATALKQVLQQAAKGQLTEPDFNLARNAGIAAYLNWNSD